jgi:hypothetical protein
MRPKLMRKSEKMQMEEFDHGSLRSHPEGCLSSHKASHLQLRRDQLSRALSGSTLHGVHLV